MKPMSKPTLWPTITASPTNSCNAGSTLSIRGALATIDCVMPVSTTTLGAIALPGLTRVAIVPKHSPPRTLTTPISVIRSPPRSVPVVSMSSTQNVTSASGMPRSSSERCTAAQLSTNARSCQEQAFDQMAGALSLAFTEMPADASAELPDEALRSALEFAVAIAAVGVKLRPPLPIPSGFKPYLRFQKLPSSALKPLRTAIESDSDFLHRLSVVATPELIDEVGMLWLTRPDGWQDTAAKAASNGAAEADEAGELRREQKRRRAAEAVAARSRLESQRLSEQLEAERATRSTVAAEVRRLKAELAAARAHMKHLERAADKRAKSEPLLIEPATKTRKTSAPEPRVRRTRKPIAVPGGLHGNSEAAGEHMLRVAGVTVLVDGYNVAKLGWKSLSLERQRNACIDAAENIARRWGTSLHIVFDGSSVVGAASPKRRLVRVSYSPAGVSADDVLRAEVAALDIARPVVVVTNDQAVVADVHAAGANVVSSDTFLALARR